MASILSVVLSNLSTIIIQEIELIGGLKAKEENLQLPQDLDVMDINKKRNTLLYLMMSGNQVTGMLFTWLSH
ncbi:hypothetical protein LIER_14110 [Lithospermum erythrorhizon]|uniref:Uncharacterized protein n=1 Tax=Lithospermum erythrorhizon TaxID=34254 RepID=A0AAV3PY13_LITER